MTEMKWKVFKIHDGRWVAMAPGITYPYSFTSHESAFRFAEMHANASMFAVS